MCQLYLNFKKIFKKILDDVASLSGQEFYCVKLELNGFPQAHTVFIFGSVLAFGQIHYG